MSCCCNFRISCLKTAQSSWISLPFRTASQPVCQTGQSLPSRSLRQWFCCCPSLLFQELKTLSFQDHCMATTGARETIFPWLGSTMALCIWHLCWWPDALLSLGRGAVSVSRCSGCPGQGQQHLSTSHHPHVSQERTELIDLLSTCTYSWLPLPWHSFLAGRPQKAPKEHPGRFQRARSYHPIQLPHVLLLCSSAEQLPRVFYPQELTTILSAEELLTLANQGNFNSQHPSSWLGQGSPRMLLSGNFWCIIFLSQNKTKQSHFSAVLLSTLWPLCPPFVIYRLSLQ